MCTNILLDYQEILDFINDPLWQMESKEVTYSTRGAPAQYSQLKADSAPGGSPGCHPTAGDPSIILHH